MKRLMIACVMLFSTIENNHIYCEEDPAGPTGILVSPKDMSYAQNAYITATGYGFSHPTGFYRIICTNSNSDVEIDLQGQPNSSGILSQSYAAPEGGWLPNGHTAELSIAVSPTTVLDCGTYEVTGQQP